MSVFKKAPDALSHLLRAVVPLGNNKTSRKLRELCHISENAQKRV